MIVEKEILIRRRSIRIPKKVQETGGRTIPISSLLRETQTDEEKREIEEPEEQEESQMEPHLPKKKGAKVIATQHPAPILKKAWKTPKSDSQKDRSTLRKAGKSVHGRKTRRRGKKETYSSYVYKVLRQIHPEIGISKMAMQVMNSFVDDLFGRLAGEASRLTRYAGKSTLSSRDMNTAVKLILPGELSKHAVSEGVKAVNKYGSSMRD